MPCLSLSSATGSHKKQTKACTHICSSFQVCSAIFLNKCGVEWFGHYTVWLWNREKSVAQVPPSCHLITVPQTIVRVTAFSAPRRDPVWRGRHGPRSPGRRLSAQLWSDMESWWSPVWLLQTHRCYSCWTHNETLKREWERKIKGLVFR